MKMSINSYFNKMRNIYVFITFYLVIPTQFGHVPDVAFEEIKQMRNQQQQQPVSLPFYAPTFVSTTSNPSINSPSSNDSLFLSSNQARPTARENPIINPTGTIRSRSLANTYTNRASVAAASTNVSNPAYQTPIFVTNKQSFSTPTRYGIGRINPPPVVTNNSLPSGPSSSSTSTYFNNRSLPISTSINIRHRANPHSQQSNVPAALSNPSSSTTTANNGQPRSHYETTYRSSFIKPLAP
jgi:hypothetical protein